MVWEIFQPFVTWLGSSPFSRWLGESTPRIALLFVFHLFGLTMLLGSTLLLSLRLLGVAMKHRSTAQLSRELGPWNLAGLALMLISGALLFTGGAETYFDGYWFRTKMQLLFLALLFRFTVFRFVARAGEHRVAPVLNKLTGLVSLVLWFAVAVSGRAIAFFD